MTPIASFQALLRIPTVSTRDAGAWDHSVFDAFHAELREQFPLLHKVLELTRVGSHGLLFRWPGIAKDRPVVLMAHIDVVPVEGEWTHPPFDAVVEDGIIWGRGTLDCKGSLAAICQAVEDLLADGHTPAQDVWLSFGCNEEVAGDAAPLAVEELRRRGVIPWFVLDEGGAVAYDAFPGVEKPIAVIGVTEKGVTSLELRVDGHGGHASTPAPLGPTARLARAITRLDRLPMRASAPDATVELFRRAAPHAKTPMRYALSAAVRSRALLTRLLLLAGPEPAAMARTTIAVTTLSGSPTLNVVAARATAGVNIRILVGDTMSEAIAHVRKVIDDPEVSIRVIDAGEPSPSSPLDEAFDLIAATTEEHFPHAVTSPYVMMAATDARHFTKISDRVYRFTPFEMTKAQRESIHTHDEHITVDAYLKGIAWYRTLIERL
ncbi:carboxypeptidase PM20D1 [Actinoplanes campanulatus]|uniref:Carboxypeptidase PM20D1 n=1 Tax=Actinoplanes campanulatus TaxID=113559 RepID=A0A7W5ASN5_9ACTN|nr:M20/M25/M40 family metallo-hydrolase [Actinoplanes campanulatus]MBB3101294.1 carboxypeptidase PM20D1 [Actinoplanes campanulatus]GGN50720.1 peptidase M20 [Actinoplanes campanulatus]GID42176.1 peptidase M20 [Actinoplanes campanulatus]